MANIPAISRYANYGHYLLYGPFDSRWTIVGQLSIVAGGLIQKIISCCPGACAKGECLWRQFCHSRADQDRFHKTNYCKQKLHPDNRLNESIIVRTQLCSSLWANLPIKIFLKPTIFHVTNQITINKEILVAVSMFKQQRCISDTVFKDITWLNQELISNLNHYRHIVLTTNR